MKKIIGIIIVLVCLFSIYSIAEEECEHNWMYHDWKTKGDYHIRTKDCTKCKITEEEKHSKYSETPEFYGNIFTKYNDESTHYLFGYCYCGEWKYVKQKHVPDYNNMTYIYTQCYETDLYAIPCKECEHIYTYTYITHNHTLNEEEKCEKCGYGYKCNHENISWINDQIYYIPRDNTYHDIDGFKKCKDCNYVYKTLEHEKHNYINGICICGKECEHDWIFYGWANSNNIYKKVYQCTNCKIYNKVNHEHTHKYLRTIIDEETNKKIELYQCECGHYERKYICDHKNLKIEKSTYTYIDNNTCLFEEETMCLDCNNIINVKTINYKHNYCNDVCEHCGHEREHTHDYEKVSDSVVWKTKEVVTKYKCFCGDTYNEHKSYSEYQQEEATSNSKEFVAPITGKPKLWVEFDDSECKTTHNCDCSNIEHEHDWELMYEEEDDNGNVVHIHYECTFSK